MNQVISSFLIIYTGNVFVCFSAIHTTCFIPHALTPPPPYYRQAYAQYRDTTATSAYWWSCRSHDHKDEWSWMKLWQNIRANREPQLAIGLLCLFVCLCGLRLVISPAVWNTHAWQQSAGSWLPSFVLPSNAILKRGGRELLRSVRSLGHCQSSLMPIRYRGSSWVSNSRACSTTQDCGACKI